MFPRETLRKKAHLKVKRFIAIRFPPSHDSDVLGQEGGEVSKGPIQLLGITATKISYFSVSIPEASQEAVDVICACLATTECLKSGNQQ